MRILNTSLKFSLLLCVCIPCIAAHPAEATADPAPPPTPIGHVLIYTDNSPGSILLASVMNQVERKRGYATRVTTTEADFIARLPEQAWTSVVVTTKYTSDTPDYSKALKQYVKKGGVALIHTWKDDAENPTQANLVSAPCAYHIWADGRTSRGYSFCRNAPKQESPVSGYVLNDFHKLTGKIGAIQEPACTALNAGEYPPLEAGAPPLSKDEPLRRLEEDIKTTLDEQNANLALCEEVYGPKPDAEPADPGDLDEWDRSKKAYREAARTAYPAAMWRYVARKKIAEREAKTTPTK